MEFTRIQDLYATKTWQTREEYAKDNNGTTPPYVPARPQKYWKDDAVDSKGNLRLGRKAGNFAIYEHGLVKDERGKWTIGPFIVPYEDAIRVNIPPDTPAAPDWNLSVFLPPLVRGLADDEEIFEVFPGVPAIRKKKIQVDVPVMVSGGFSEEDRARLGRIEKLASKIAEFLGLQT